MHHKKTEGLTLVEIEDVTPELLEELHNFLRISMVPALRKVEILKTREGKPRTACYSALFTVVRARAVVEWLEQKGVKLKTQ